MLHLKAFLIALVVSATPALAMATPDGGAVISDMAVQAVDAGVQAMPSDPTADLGGWVKAAYTAAQGGQYRMLAAILLIGLVSVTRKYGAKVPGKVGAYVASDRGGASVTLGLALIAGIIHALLAGVPLGLPMLATAVYISFLAAGGYTLAKKAGFGDILTAAGRRIGLVAVLVLATASGGCAWLQAHPKILAGLECAQGVAIEVVTALAAALLGPADWAQVGLLEAKYGLDAVVCAAQKLAAPPVGAAVNPDVVKNARAYLALRGLGR